MKGCVVVGARPQFIKYVPLARVFSEQAEKGEAPFSPVLIHTGQHYDYDMSRVFFDQLQIPAPDYHLEVGSGFHGKQTAAILERAEDVLAKEKPDTVIVFGDTNSTLGAALAAVKMHIPVVHIEAGLRSFEKRMPEEVNRIMTDHASSLLFCPSRTAVGHLEREGFGRVLNQGALVTETDAQTLDAGGPVNADHPLVANSGDIMYDVLLHARELAHSRSTILADRNLTPKQYGLVTLHRAENTDNASRFARMTDFINAAAADTPLIFPMHPRTRKIYETQEARFSDAVQITGPAGYFDLIRLLEASRFLLTDSGGMQKEAFWLGVPCVTLRDETEWVETVESGWNVLYKDFNGIPEPPESVPSVYGSGRTAPVLSHLIRRFLS